VSQEVPTVWILLAPLIGCPATDGPDPPTSDASLPIDTATTDTTTVETGNDDSGATDTAVQDTDTGPAQWQDLPNDCTPPTANGVDPFQMEGSLTLTQETGTQGWFVEILDLAYLPEQNRVLAVGQGGLVVYETSEGADPTLLGHTGPDSSSSERFYNLLPTSEDRVWVTHRDHGVSLVSIADPETPEVVAEAQGRGFQGLAEAGTWLYVASTDGSLEVFDADPPGQVAHQISVFGLGRPWDVYVADDVAWVADGERGVIALDLTDASAPELAGEAASEGSPTRLTATEPVRSMSRPVLEAWRSSTCPTPWHRCAWARSTWAVEPWTWRSMELPRTRNSSSIALT
jgi:hypothetical protein